MSINLLTTGTIPFPFPRLTHPTINYFTQHPSQTLIVQTPYPSTLPNNLSPNIKVHKFISFNKMIKLYKQANLIVSASGEGSVLLILKYAQNKPIFMPRLREHSEHIDNQQLKICRHLEKKQLAQIAYTRSQLKKSLTQPLKPNSFASKKQTPSKLINYLQQITL